MLSLLCVQHTGATFRYLFYFNHLYHPLSVETRVHRMQQMSTWGTHAEIKAMALYFNLPVYVAVQKDPDADTCNNYRAIGQDFQEGIVNRIMSRPLPVPST